MSLAKSVLVFSRCVWIALRCRSRSGFWLGDADESGRRLEPGSESDVSRCPEWLRLNAAGRDRVRHHAGPKSRTFRPCCVCRRAAPACAHVGVYTDGWRLRSLGPMAFPPPRPGRGKTFRIDRHCRTNCARVHSARQVPGRDSTRPPLPVSRHDPITCGPAAGISAIAMEREW